MNINICFFAMLALFHVKLSAADSLPISKESKHSLVFRNYNDLEGMLLQYHNNFQVRCLSTLSRSGRLALNFKLLIPPRLSREIKFLLLTYIWDLLKEKQDLLDFRNLNVERINTLFLFPVEQWEIFEKIIGIHAIEYIDSVEDALHSFNRFNPDGILIKYNPELYRFFAVKKIVTNHPLTNHRASMVQNVEDGNRFALLSSIIDISVAHLIITDEALLDVAKKRKFSELRKDLQFLLKTKDLSDIKKRIALIDPQSPYDKRSQSKEKKEEREKCTVM